MRFPKQRTITFFWSKLSKLHKKDPSLHVATTFSLKLGETRTSHGPIPHPLSKSVSLRYIRGSQWSSGLGVCLARRRSWVRFPRRQIPRFFLSGCLLCGSRLMLSKFNCNTLGWKTVPFIIWWRSIAYVYMPFSSWWRSKDDQFLWMMKAKLLHL